MGIKNILKDYFSFSKKEFRGIIIMLILIVILYTIPLLYHPKNLAFKTDPKLEKQINDLFRDDSATDNNSNNIKKNVAVEMFPFDPNIIDSMGWKRLGIAERTIHTILNYRNKGGWFKDTGDIRKIWSIKKEDADRLIPFMTIKEREKKGNPKTEWLKKKDVIPTLASIDINTAEAEYMNNIPGLKYPLPYKIISYREKLGGFLNIEQLKEVQGMDDTIYLNVRKYFIMTALPLKKVNINTATDDDLSQHPYISRSVAKAIFIYRQQHGNYKQVEDIKKIIFIKENVFKKIAPYLSVND